MPYGVIGGVGVMALGEGVTMDNPCNILSLNNVIYLCDDMVLKNYTRTKTLATLSNEIFYPKKLAIVPCFLEHDGNVELVGLYLNSLGQFYLSIDVADGILHTNGLCLNVNSRYYTPEIGNIYDNNTSPIDAV